jgi:hypothetical protein
MKTADLPPLRLRVPADVLAAVPYLLGFHPADSIVALGMRGRHLTFHVRGDLPEVGASTPEIADYARYVVALFRRQSVTSVLLVGYGPADRATRLLLAARAEFAAAGITVTELLRATDGRYWSYLCEALDCCPAEGTPYDVAGSRIAAEATLAGCVALPDRATLVRRLDPPTGPDLATMVEATARAEVRLVGQLDVALAKTGKVAAEKALVAQGERAVARAVARYEAGSRLTDDEVAELSLLLAATDVRDVAWRRLALGPPDQETGAPAARTRPAPDLAPHLRLWSDVVSRACPDLVAPAASLLSYAAWRTGDGVMAAIALDRALTADRAYPMAQLMAQVLHNGIPPSTMDGMVGGRKPRRRRRRSRSRTAR